MTPLPSVAVAAIVVFVAALHTLHRCNAEDQPEKQWDNIIRKAIKKTKVANREKAFEEISSLLHS